MIQSRKTVVKICLQCNKVFSPAVSEVKRGNGKFCNLSCLSTYRNLHYMPIRTTRLEMKICSFCNKKFEHKPSSIGKFCSFVCKNNFMRGKRPGPLQQNVRRKIKQIAFNIYGEKCEICEYALAVDVHHLIPRSEGGEDINNNLAVLCPNHHREVHMGILTKEDIFKYRKQRVEMEGYEPSSRTTYQKLLQA